MYAVGKNMNTQPQERQSWSNRLAYIMTVAGATLVLVQRGVSLI
ncbi:transporter domain protein [Glaesserella parasuis H465]|nr:transporter domain protein [Glaesserella parasuis H465]